MGSGIERSFLNGRHTWQILTSITQSKSALLGVCLDGGNRKESDYVVKLEDIHGHNSYFYMEKESFGLWKWVDSSTGMELLEKSGKNTSERIIWTRRSGETLIHLNQFLRVRSEESDLIITTIFFPTSAEATKFVRPEHAGEEISGKDEYSNFSLCLKGVPKR
jgi:hypothetical protein